MSWLPLVATTVVSLCVLAAVPAGDDTGTHLDSKLACPALCPKNVNSPDMVMKLFGRVRAG